MRKLRCAAGLSCLWLLVYSAASADADLQTLSGRLQADEPWNINENAMPVGLISDMLVVGVPKDPESGNNAGAVFVFRRAAGDWVQSQKLVPESPAAGYAFGFSLSIEEQIDSGEAWLAVGAPQADGSTGRVYLYQRNGDTWEFDELLTGAEIGDFFGHAVAINVDIPAGQEDPLWTLATGAPGYRFDGKAFDTGAVFISNYNDIGGWFPPFVPIDAATHSNSNNSRIGHSVALDGDVIIAGAPNQQVSGQNAAGAVYFAVRGVAGTWVQGAGYPNPDPIDGEVFGGARFGESVAVVKQIVPTRVLTGNFYYLVGAPDTTSEIVGGQTYILDGTAGGVTNSQRLTRPDQQKSSDAFGYSVAFRQDLVNGDHEVVIASRPDTDGADGAVFTYNQTDLLEPWLPTRKYVIPNTDVLPDANARVGQGVAAWNGWVAASASNLNGGEDAVFTNPIVIFKNSYESP